MSLLGVLDSVTGRVADLFARSVTERERGLVVTGAPSSAGPAVVWGSASAEKAAPVWGTTGKGTPSADGNGFLDTAGFYDLVLSVALTAGTSVDVAVYVWDAALENYVWRKTVTVTATQMLDPIDLGATDSAYVAVLNLVGEPTFAVSAAVRA